MLQDIVTLTAKREIKFPHSQHIPPIIRQTRVKAISRKDNNFRPAEYDSPLLYFHSTFLADEERLSQTL